MMKPLVANNPTAAIATAYIPPLHPPRPGVVAPFPSTNDTTIATTTPKTDGIVLSSP